MGKHEQLLTLGSEREADIATEYGDGTQFKPGDRVINDFKKGTYRAVKVVAENSGYGWVATLDEEEPTVQGLGHTREQAVENLYNALEQK